LNDEKSLVRQTARQFVETKSFPSSKSTARSDVPPKHLIRSYGELGFFGANLHGYGCAECPTSAYGLIEPRNWSAEILVCAVLFPCRASGDVIRLFLWSDTQKVNGCTLLQQGKAHRLLSD